MSGIKIRLSTDFISLNLQKLSFGKTCSKG
jgi:hypothetical protein